MMDQKRLHRTVETIASKKFASEKDLLIKVLNQIVENKNIDVIGGRIWKLDKDEKAYRLLYQCGKVDKIETNFAVYLHDYPVFDLIADQRTILSDETNIMLRQKGIFKYSASGIGEKCKINGNYYYDYLVALNSEVLGDDLKYTLNIIATALTSQLKQRKISKREQILKADINRARDLQKSILPEHEYSFHDFDLFGLTIPAEIVGGDFFDYLEIGDNDERLGITLGDAASKGLSAAAEAMYISGAIRMASTFEIKISPLMRRMNQLVNKIFEDDKFASLFYAEISTDKNGLCLYANAGHNPPMFIRKDSDEITLLHSTGPVLGPAPNARYETENINFSQGDVLIIYSDGITESVNKNELQYEEERLAKILRKSKHLSPKQIAYSIIDDVVKFSVNGKYSDDKTLVVIKRERKST